MHKQKLKRAQPKWPVMLHTSVVNSNLNGMWGTSGMITIDSDASKSFYRTVIKTEQSKGKTWLTAASQYFGESTRVLSGQYSSTLGAVLEYCHRSTGVFLGEYSSIPTGVLWRPLFLTRRHPFWVEKLREKFSRKGQKLRELFDSPLAAFHWCLMKSEGWNWKGINPLSNMRAYARVRDGGGLEH